MNRLSVLLLVIAGVATNLDSLLAADSLPDQTASALKRGQPGRRIERLA